MKATKLEIANGHVRNATGMFSEAHESLQKAIQLLSESEDEHRGLADDHAQLADGAKATREQSERVQGRLAALLS